MSVDAQRRALLERANVVRVARAELKAQVKALGGREGARLVARTLLDVPWFMVNLEIGELLRWIPRWGDWTVITFLSRIEVSPIMRIGDARSDGAGQLTARRRKQIADALVK